MSENNNQPFGKIGIFDLRKGFKRTGSPAYPKERLVAFLNVNSDNQDEIKKFGEDYKFVFLPIGSTYKAEFEKYRQPIKEIADYYWETKDLKEEHIKSLNEQLSKIKYEFVEVTKDDISETNNLLDPQPESFEIEKRLSKNKYFAFVSHHPDFYTSLWEDLAKMIVKEQEFGRCASCSGYFIPKEKSHNQRYCSLICQDRYKKNKKRQLEKIK